MTMSSEPAASSGTQSYAVEFKGTSAEYFRIWVVNLTLSIITLGIYSAWATVRTRRYFLGNTVIDGSSFDYHASPARILRGRLIAVLVILLFSFGDVIHSMIIPVTLILMLIAAPWLFRSALRFRRRMTSYRNVRFNFTGTTGQAFYALLPGYIYMIGFLVLVIVSIPGVSESPDTLIAGLFIMLMFTGLFIYPVLQYLTSKYGVSKTRFGDKQFTACFTLDGFGRIFLAFFGVNLLAGLVALAGVIMAYFVVEPQFTSLDQVQEGYDVSVVLTTLLLYLWAALCFSAGHAYWSVAKRNLIVNNSHLDNMYFRSKMEFTDYLSLLITNLLAVICSLGFAYPWARIRMAQYHAQTLSVHGDLGAFTAEQTLTSDAVGEEVADMLDLDLGF